MNKLGPYLGFLARRSSQGLSLGHIARSDCVGSSKFVRSFSVGSHLATEMMIPPEKDQLSPRLGNEGLEKLKKIKSSPSAPVKVFIKSR